MVPRRVIISGDLALLSAEQRMRIRQAARANIADEQVEMAAALGRDPGETLAVGRQPRLDIDRTASRQLLLGAAGQIEPPQLDAVTVVTIEDDTLPVRR